MALTNCSEEINRLRQYPAEIRFKMLNNLLKWLRRPILRVLFGRPLRRKMNSVVAASGSDCINQLISALTTSNDPYFSQEVLLHLSALPERDIEGNDICIQLFKTGLGSPSVNEGIKVCLSAINICFAPRRE
jgi:hypothetical protein